MVWDEAKWSGLKDQRSQRPEQCVGKTIAWSYMDPEMLGFLFDDGTYFLAGVILDGDEASIETIFPMLTPEIALNLKLISPEEYQAKQADRLRLQEARERQQYEELKKKYGGSEGSGE